MEHAHDQLEPLYHHSKRPKWGFAILAWEGNETRHYQFQDGQLRTFKKGWYELLKPVDEPYDSARDIVRDLKSMLRIERVRRAPEPTPKSLKRIVSFDDQLTIFKAFYPETFEDPEWISEVRGSEDRTRLKRHREAASKQAQEMLAEDILDELIEKEDYVGVWERVKDVLASTNLTSSKDTAALRNLPEDRLPLLAKAVRELLWGDDPFESRFTRWVTVLSKTPNERVTWPLATSIPALVHPTERVAVKPSVFRSQAQWMAPSLPYDPHPSSDLYGRLQKMSSEVSRRLEKNGHTPRDYFDVYDFIWTTLRPKGRKMLDDLNGAKKK